MKSYLLVDAFNQWHRYYHGMPTLTAPDGTHTHVVYAWANFLLETYKRVGAPHDAEVIVFIDGPGRGDGQALVEGYKAGREESPETFLQQIPLAIGLTKMLGVNYVRERGVEADHLIGSFVLNEKAKGDAGGICYVMSSDKDLLQLVDDKTFVIKAKNGLHVKMGRQEVFQRWKVWPESIPDLLICMGDKSDNIPNVPGVGEKTAQSLLETYGSLDGILANLDRLKPKIRQSFIDCMPNFDNVRKLVQFAPGEVRVKRHQQDLESALTLCRNLGMTSVIGKLMNLQ